MFAFASKIFFSLLLMIVVVLVAHPKLEGYCERRFGNGAVVDWITLGLIAVALSGPTVLVGIEVFG